MRITAPVQSHDQLLGVTSDQHHAQLHVSSHAVGGSDALGAAGIAMNNNVSYGVRDTGGTVRSLGLMTLTDSIRLGDSGFNLQLQNNGNLVERVSGTNYDVLTRRRVITVRKSADEIVNNSTVLQDDDALRFAVGANTTWLVIMAIAYTMAGTQRIRMALSLPTGATATSHVARLYAGAWTGDRLDNTNPISADADPNAIVQWHAMIVVGATGGNVILQWAQDVAEANNTTVKAGSLLYAIQVG